MTIGYDRRCRGDFGDGAMDLLSVLTPNDGGNGNVRRLSGKKKGEKSC